MQQVNVLRNHSIKRNYARDANFALIIEDSIAYDSPKIKRVKWT